MLTLLLFLVLSADAKTSATTVQAAKIKVIQIGVYQPPFTVTDSASRAGVTLGVTMTLHGWSVENVSCPTISDSGLITISYAATTDGALPTITVTASVKNPQTGRIVMFSALDVYMDGTIEVFKAMDGTDPKDLALGQTIYDAGLQCFVPSPTAYY